MDQTPQEWLGKRFENMEEIVAVLNNLEEQGWLCRGQDICYEKLVPKIDRASLQSLDRLTKLRMERESIDVFRTSVTHFASSGEENSRADDFIALAVLQHYGVHTRLLDWSASPWVAAWFAVQDNEKNNGDADGEFWAFNEPAYSVKGRDQWRHYPETTKCGTGHPLCFDANLTAFLAHEPPPWIIAMNYPKGFPRQNAQKGRYTITSRFGQDHARVLAELFDHDGSNYVRYVIPKNLKQPLQRHLRQCHGIWRGSLFPDSAGAAETAHLVVFDGEAR